MFHAFLSACCVENQTRHLFLVNRLSDWNAVLANFSTAGRVIAAAVDVGSFFHRLTSFTAIFFRGAAGTDRMRAFFCFRSH
jgi:hypothetical protein